MAKQEAEIQFSFEEEGKLTVRIGSPVTPGWKIQPLATPCIVSLLHSLGGCVSQFSRLKLSFVSD